MTKDDRFYLNRVALFSHAERVGVSQACRDFRIHRSTHYRWRRQVLRYGLEILRPRERRLPRMPNQLPVWHEQTIISFALAHPGLGPRRLAAQLAQPNPLGQLSVSASGVLKVLHRHGLGTRQRRLAFVAGYAAPPEREPPPRPVALHLEAEQPGDLVQFDCFHIGTLSGTKGKVWQYTAVDVGQLLHLGSGPPNRAQSLSQVHYRARSPRRPRALSSWLEAPRYHYRQRPGVQVPRLRHRRGQFWCRTALHPSRASTDERRRREGPTHDPGGVLEANLRPLTGAALHSPQAGSGRLPRLLQL